MNRSTTIATLTEAILGGDLRRDYIPEILGERELMPLDDQLTLLRGNADQRLNVAERINDYLTELVSAWLETSATGAQLIEEREEQEREDAEELAELDRSAA